MIPRPRPLVPDPGQESVWDYPRPPRLERVGSHIVIRFAGQIVAETHRALRVLETSHPPSYYLPPRDVNRDFLIPARGTSFCEWKGEAVYWTVRMGENEAPRSAWSYPSATASFAPLANYFAFYCAAMESCTIDGALARPQPGGFYGGWVTDNVVGPFKGDPGSQGW